MSTKVTITVLFLLNYFSTVGQMNQFSMENTTTLDITLFNGDDDSNSYEGSPYIDDRFYMAKVNEYKETYPVRYNASEDRMEVKINENRIIALDHLKTDYTISFLESGDTYKSMEVSGAKGYFIELWKNNGNMSLLKKVSIKYYPKKESSNGYSPEKPARFVRQKDTYYLSKEGDYMEIPNSVNKLGKMLGNSDLKALAKNNGLDIDDEKDLVKLFEMAF